MNEADDHPAVLVFPPLLLGGAMVLGALLDGLHPIPLFAGGWARFVGAALFALGVTLAGFAHSALRRAGTHIRPDQPTLALVTDGPYRRTRNPLYLAGLSVYLGVCFFVNGVAPFVLFLPLAVLLDWGVVRREERYLAAKFGDRYRAYQREVRRWL